MNDPFVNDVRQFRHEHARQFHDNVSAMCDDLRSIQAACGQGGGHMSTETCIHVSTSAKGGHVRRTRCGRIH